MNIDIEKNSNLHEGKEEYPLYDVDAKKDDTDEPAENSPLNGDYEATNMDSKENDANAPSDKKEGHGKGIREWLSKSRVKWWIAILVAVVLLTVVLVGTLLAVEEYEDDFEDTTRRLVKLWPRPNMPKNVIHFVHGSLPFEGRVWPDIIPQLDRLMQPYQIKPNRSGTLVECYGPNRPEGRVCAFDIGHLSLECSKSMNYGYDQGKPCIFLEFNNITHWVPEAFTARDLESLTGLPEDVKLLYGPMQVFLDCQGDTLVDRENIGPVQYSPDRGFPARYFPYTGQPDYMSPLVAVRFANPAVGVAVSVTCKLWAKNVNHTIEAEPSGSISFNLLVD